MNNQEYEQKKSECWEEYTRKCVHESKSAYGAFDFAFDRAYTLGKQDKDAYAVIQGWVARGQDGYISYSKTSPQGTRSTKAMFPMAFGMKLTAIILNCR